jgi:hypothetical protein
MRTNLPIGMPQRNSRLPVGLVQRGWVTCVDLVNHNHPTPPLFFVSVENKGTLSGSGDILITDRKLERGQVWMVGVSLTANSP